jgi:hypothetical protein
LIENDIDLVINQFPRISPQLPKDWTTFNINEWKERRLAFVHVRDLIEEGKIPELAYQALENHALLGAGLQSKFDLLTKSSRRVRDQMGLQLPTRITRKLLDWLLGLVEKYLDSLVAAFPVLGAVKEFKGAVESGLELPDVFETSS